MFAKKISKYLKQKFVFSLKEPVPSLGLRCRQNFLSEKQHNIFWMAIGLIDYKFIKKPYCSLCKRQ